jgi:geranylgeranyl pyrophosphate synthase
MLYEEDGALVRKLEARLEASIPRALPGYAREPVHYCLSRKGKRLRARAALLSSPFVGGTAEAALPAAVAVELLHNFTLVHDDVMDGDLERRGSASVHARFGLNRGLLGGDALLALSVGALAELGPTLGGAVLPAFSATLNELCHGQALDQELEDAPDVTFERYLDMAARKTGALFELACTLGGHCARASGVELRALAEFGRTFGVVYQLKDDLRDFFADARTLGRRPGSDHRRRKQTSVAILARLALAETEPESSLDLSFEAVRERLRDLGVERRLEAEIERRARTALAALCRIRSDAEALPLWRLASTALASERVTSARRSA